MYTNLEEMISVLRVCNDNLDMYFVELFILHKKTNFFN